MPRLRPFRWSPQWLCQPLLSTVLKALAGGGDQVGHRIAALKLPSLAIQ